jgi:hypothetical protein
MEALNPSEQQKQFLADHGVSFDYARMSEEDLEQLEQELADLLVLKGLDENYDDNEIGRQVREIMELLE